MTLTTLKEDPDFRNPSVGHISLAEKHRLTSGYTGKVRFRAGVRLNAEGKTPIRGRRPVVGLRIADAEVVRAIGGTAAARRLGLPLRIQSNITDCCQKKILHASGYIWRYADDWENPSVRVEAEALRLRVRDKHGSP